MALKSTGLSKHRLEKLHGVLRGYVQRQEIPGIVALVSRNDDVHVETLGTLTVDGGEPMQRDTIFRVASIVKPVTAAAAMILVEDCALRLDDSVEPWLPELANRRVLKSIASEIDDTVPAVRPITVRHLLTSTMGFGSVMARPATYPIQKYIRDYRLGGDGPPRPSASPTAEEWLRGLGSLPLMAQPGDRWMYQISMDALGVLIARVSGQSLGEFMRERIFEPLGMKDSGFHVPADKLDRLPSCYFYDRRAGTVETFDDRAGSAWSSEPPFESGGGGLVSTVDDYFAFSRMMLNNGRHRSEQILSRAAVELMTSDQLTPEQRGGNELFFGDYRSWGFGMGVVTRRNEIFHTPGQFGWEGGFGTCAYADPAEGMICILLSQRMMDSPERPRVFTDFLTSAYAAME